MSRSSQLGRWVLRSPVRLASRSWVLFVTLVVAASGFSVLTGQAETARLGVVETAEANARSAYDVLVRPPGARLPLEDERGLVQPSFLVSYPQGITQEQWREIQAIPGVEVAAPIAVIGWVIPSVQASVDLSAVTSGMSEPTLLRRETVWSYDNGASTIQAAPRWEYLTPNAVQLHSDLERSGSWLVERFPDGRFVEHRNLVPLENTTVQDSNGVYDLVCVEVRPNCRFAYHSVEPAFPYPFLVVAVDPAAEAELSGLDAAVSTGSYLSDAEPARRDISAAQDGTDPRQMIPVLVADAPQLQLSATFTVENLGAGAAAAAVETVISGESLDRYAVSGSIVAEGTITAAEVYQELVDDMTTTDRRGAYYATSIMDVYRTGPGEFTTGLGDSLVAEVVPPDPLAWQGRFDRAEALMPPGADDTAFRDLTGFVAMGGGMPPGLEKVGTFDASTLVGSALSEVPLGTYAFSPPVGTDAESLAALDNSAWEPSASIWGFVQAPPLMVTNLASLPVFSDPSVWSGVARAGMVSEGLAPVELNALTAIRVRVADVDGIDPVSRERVRLVAETIATRTGLDVDITLGSSPSPQTIEVAAGIHGRPELAVEQNWVLKGVAVMLVSAADRKSLLLNLAVLVVCGIVVNNAALASVRARRREIATLRLTGWTTSALVRAELGTLLVTSLAAGAAAAVLALLIGGTAGFAVSLPQAALAIPAAVVVALVAGAAAAASAARAPALAAVRPAGSHTSRGTRRSVRGRFGMAMRAVLAAPGRASLTVAAVAVATAALSVLLAIQTQFQGIAVGSLLGDAIALQVRGPDLVAAATILLLAGVGVAHSLTIEVRERAPELATLRATGWRESTLAQMLLTQALLVGIVGAIIGTATAIAVQLTVLGALTPAMLAANAAAAALGIAVAAVATWAPARLLARIPTPTLLAEE